MLGKGGNNHRIYQMQCMQEDASELSRRCLRGFYKTLRALIIKYLHDISEVADASLSSLLFLFDIKSKMRRRESESAWCMSMLSMLSLRTSSLLPLIHALFWTRAQIQAHYSSSPILPSSSPLICGLALITTGENDIPT